MGFIDEAEVEWIYWYKVEGCVNIQVVKKLLN